MIRIESTPLRVLILEDVASDAELLVHTLRRSGLDFTWELVETEMAFAQRLDDPPDVILADYSMPNFGAYRAMEMLAERGIVLPFIVVSGTIGEELAASMIRIGASDYVLKENLGRLRTAVDAALERARLRTRARQAIAALREAEERYRELFENANDIVFTSDLQGRITSINKAGERLAGVPRDELVGVVNAFDLLSSGSIERGLRLQERLLSGESAHESEEFELTTPDERVVHLEVNSRPIVEDGEVVGVQGIGRDISGRVAAEATIRESQRRLKALFDNSLDAIWITDDQGRFVDANPAGCVLSGYELEELLKLSIWDLTPEPNIDQARETWKAFLDAGVLAGDYEVRQRDGTVVDTEFSAVANVVPGLHMASIRDITERRAAEEDLRAASNRLQALVEASPLAIYTLDADGVVQDWNAAAEHIYGWTADEAVGHRLLTVSEEGRDERDRIREGVLRGLGFTGREVKRVRKDGTSIEVSLSVAPLPDVSGEVTGILAIAADVTERNRAQAELLESQERFSQFAENFDHALWMADVVGDSFEIRFANPACERMWGESMSDGHVVQNWIERVHPDDRASLVAGLEALLGAQHQDSEYRSLLPDGGTSWLRARAFPVLDAKGRTFRVVGITEDITERKEAESVRDRLTSILEETSDFVATSDVDGRIKYLNAAGRRALGIADDEDLSTGTFSRYLPDWTAQLVLETGFPAALRDGTWTGETAWLSPERSEIPLSQVLIAHRDADGTAYVSTVARDMTERLRFEADLRSNLRQLQEADEQRRHLLLRLVNAQEEERQRIASDIHDDSVQVMTAVGLRLHTLRSKLTDPGLAAAAEQIEATVGLSILRLRRLLFELRPRALDTEGLAAALQMYLEQTSPEAGLEYRLESSLVDEPVPDARLVLYRIAQEALTNVRKHAKASRIVVELSESDDGWLVRISDDGVGVKASNGHGTPGHQGTEAMHDRVQTAGGWLRIEPDPAGGTVVEYWIPARMGAAP